MVTVQSDLQKRERWNPARYLSILEKCLAGVFEGEAPISEAMLREIVGLREIWTWVLEGQKQLSIAQKLAI